MNSLDTQIRWLVTAVGVVAAALLLVAPAGAWEDPEGGRQAGNGQGSLPTQFDQESTVAANAANAADVGTVVASMNPGVVVSNGKTFVPGVNASGDSVLIEVGPNLRVSDAESGSVVASMNPGVIVRNGKTFVPGVNASGDSVLIEVAPNPSSSDRSFSADSYLQHARSEQVAGVQPTPASGSSDDSIELGTLPLTLAGALAVAALMALTAVTVRRRRHVLLH